MSEKKVYYKDPYQRTLETTRVSSKTDEKGSWFTFEETIFYPMGGGQSPDKGWINSYDLIDVQISDGEIWHLIESPIPERVSMVLDWDHRYANMQQHTGQHILSACFKNLHDLDTTSVHLGQDITMIELNTPEIEESVLDATEIAANQIIRENIPVASITVSRGELENYTPRRTIKTSDEMVRLIQIGKIDCIGCGGVHVRSTAEVGLIKITGVEKIRGHMRIKIKIGTTAYQYFGMLHRTMQKVSNHLTTSVEDLADRVESLQAEKRDLISEVKKINGLWLSEFVKNLAADEETGCFYLKDLSAEQLKILSDLYLKIHDKPCFFISAYGKGIYFIIRFPGDFNKNVQDFLRTNKKDHSFKGGGAKDFAVGRIEKNNPDEFSPEKLFHSFKAYVQEKSRH